MMYRAALGKEPEVVGIVPVLLGVLFVWIGNDLPKLRQNSTLGVKVSWTLGNEENWNGRTGLPGSCGSAEDCFWLLGALASAAGNGLGDDLRDCRAGHCADCIFLRHFQTASEGGHYI